MNTNTSIDSLLDSTLDDLADMPEFKPFPPGFHKVSIAFEPKKMGEKTGIEMKLTYLEVLELSDPTDVPPVKGDSTSVSYFLDTEIGQGSLKEILKPLKEAFGTTTPRETMAAAKDAVVGVVTKVRSNKEDATKKYTQVVSLAVM